MAKVLVTRANAADGGIRRMGQSQTMKPHLSYTIWFSQRTGSTLLCKALESTGIAGKPNEWLHPPEGQHLLAFYGLSTPADLQTYLWQLGSTNNGVFGLKFGVYEPHFSQVLHTLSYFPACPPPAGVRATIWHHAFPNSHHIFMTRRNKVRLAVSWWKAIQTQEWHRQEETDTVAPVPDLRDAYLFEAIDHLYNECTMREAAIEAFFSEAGIVPLTVVYEDLILRYEETVHTTLHFLGLDSEAVPIAPPYFTKLADDVSEEWVQRFREEKQRGWTNRAW